MAPKNNPVEHLFVIFANNKSKPHLCMATFLSRVKARKIPHTETRLFKGDHPFVREESFLVYAETKTYYQGEISPCIVTFEERLSPELLFRIQSTCLHSRFMPKKYKKDFCNWMGIPYSDVFQQGYLSR